MVNFLPEEVPDPFLLAKFLAAVLNEPEPQRQYSIRKAILESLTVQLSIQARLSKWPWQVLLKWGTSSQSHLSLKEPSSPSPTSQEFTWATKSYYYFFFNLSWFFKTFRSKLYFWLFLHWSNIVLKGLYYAQAFHLINYCRILNLFNLVNITQFFLTAFFCKRV